MNVSNKKSSIPKLPGLKHKVIEIKQDDDNTEENEEMSKVMGFSGFGRVKQRNNEKTARKFDLDKMLAEAKTKWKPVENQDDESSNSNLEMKNEQKTNIKHEQHDSESDEDDAIGPPLPPGFSQESKEEDEDEDELIGPPLPPGFSKDEEDDDFDDEDEEQDTGSRYDVLPVSYEIELIHGSKSVTALAIDPNGSRVVSGGVDYEMRFWDFQGMDSSLQSFRAISPCESHPIKNLEFSSNGDVILVISGACVAKIVDRDGFVKGETVKGDQYITDMAHTKGHVAMLNDGIWHPRDKETFITCSNDGTCRVWSIDSLRQHISLIKPRSSGGLKAIPNSCRYTRDTQTITLGCNDGSIQMWDTRRGFVNSSTIIRDAHQKATEITCIQYSYDGTNLLSRGTDETLKLWDMKMTKKPLFVKNDLFNRFSMTDCFFSPDDNLVATGTSCRKGETSGKIMFFSKNDFELKYEMKATEGGIIRSSWHPKLNQIVVGATNGIVKVYYDPERSERGAKLCVVKSKRKYRESYEIIQPQIITRKFYFKRILNFISNLIRLSFSSCFAII